MAADDLACRPQATTQDLTAAASPVDDATSSRPGRRFGLLWAGQSGSLLGDQVTLLALPLAALSLGAHPWQVAVLGATLRLPFLVVGLPAGVWVARVGLRRSMVLADLLRGAAVLLVAAAGVTHRQSLPLIVTAGLLIGTGTVFFQVAYQSFLPHLLTGEQTLHAANVRLSLSESGSLLLGPGLAGLLIGAVGALRSLLLDTLTHAGSVLTLLMIGPVPDDRDTGPRRRLRREIADGWRAVTADPVLRSLMWVGATYNLGSAAYESVLVVFAVHDLHLTPTALGAALAAGGAGFPIGGLLSTPLVRRVGRGHTLLLAAVPSVAGLLLAGAAAGPAAGVVLAAGTFLVGLGQGAFAPVGITLRQLHAPPALRSRATAAHRFVSWGALPVGALLAGLLSSLLGLRLTILIAGALTGACFWPLLTAPFTRRTPARKHTSTR